MMFMMSLSSAKIIQAAFLMAYLTEREFIYQNNNTVNKHTIVNNIGG